MKLLALGEEKLLQVCSSHHWGVFSLHISITHPTLPYYWYMVSLKTPDALIQLNQAPLHVSGRILIQEQWSQPLNSQPRTRRQKHSFLIHIDTSFVDELSKLEYFRVGTFFIASTSQNN